MRRAQERLRRQESSFETNDEIQLEQEELEQSEHVKHVMLLEPKGHALESRTILLE